MTMIAPGAHPTMPPPPFGPLLPRHGEPGWTLWSRRLWPIDPLASAPPRLLLAAVPAALAGTAVWRPSVLSIGYLVAGVLVVAVVLGTAGRRPTARDAVGIALTLALLTVPGVLAAEWLGALCIMAAWITGWLTIAGGRTWTAVFTASFTPWAAVARATGWARRGVRGSVTGRRMPDIGRAAVVIAVTVVVALVFGGLFAAADAAFAHLLASVTPALRLDEFVARAVVFVFVLLLLLTGGYLVRCPPRLDAMAPATGKPLRRWEWAVPLAVLDALFVAFVAVQATVLFGGDTHVLETEGLTYAEYARQGFWQLLGVSALTMVVLAVVIRVAARATVADRTLLRIFVGLLCAASVVVVVSAIHRMWLYQQAYGFSTERLLVITIELWLGAVFLLVAAAGIRLTGRWLPRAVLIAGVLALLGLAALNPERLIADRNIDRYEQTGLLDTGYLTRLSSDIDPALHRLPDHLRSCVTAYDQPEDAWYLFNLSRSRADRPSLSDVSDTCAHHSYDALR
ncbi:DUF4173 domain-containing protein [Mycobacterium sp. PS03-16]|uniref:DUF4153 domain-containing protein n=1 Tax=Mycobacterium sp. PS03-16 TaxID=2559611 RepID=UPI0010737369|nr:DUF4173 domain-containing protein [Mycobacterium sp. PS03-16]TFV59962.1 DUF4173 domain-containing protein [Mycobacterium sp. PS03-16]